MHTCWYQVALHQHHHHQQQQQQQQQFTHSTNGLSANGPLKSAGATSLQSNFMQLASRMMRIHHHFVLSLSVDKVILSRLQLVFSSTEVLWGSDSVTNMVEWSAAASSGWQQHEVALSCFYGHA
jgi:hypothetical protein